MTPSFPTRLSSDLLCEEVRLNLAYRWFCRRGSIARCPIPRPFQRTGTGAGGQRSLAQAVRDDSVAMHGRRDRKRVVYGKSVSVRVDLGGRRIIKTKQNIYNITNITLTPLKRHK